MFTSLDEKTMQSFCTYREGIPHQVTQGPLSISEQIWVPEPLPRAQSPCCRLPVCRQVPTHTSEPRRFRSPRRRFTSLQANLTQTQSPFPKCTVFQGFTQTGGGEGGSILPLGLFPGLLRLAFHRPLPSPNLTCAPN